jgi:hypothetical protein
MGDKMEDKMETGLKVCADTKRHLDEWERRQKMAEARRQTDEARALRKMDRQLQRGEIVQLCQWLGGPNSLAEKSRALPAPALIDSARARAESARNPQEAI